MPWILMLAASSASGALGQAPAWIVGRGLNQFEWDFLNEAFSFGVARTALLLMVFSLLFEFEILLWVQRERPAPDG